MPYNKNSLGGKIIITDTDLYKAIETYFPLESNKDDIYRLFNSYYDDGKTPHQRQDEKRKIETKIRNAEDDEMYHIESFVSYEHNRADKLTKSEIVAELRKICKHTSINKQKEVTSIICNKL